MSKFFVMCTINLTGKSSELSCDFFPPIEVSKNAKICLLGFQTNNSIPNITDNCNKIGFTSIGNENYTISDIYTIPTGSYELSEIETVIKNMLLVTGKTFELKANSNTLKCEMSCSISIDLSMENNIFTKLKH